MSDSVENILHTLENKRIEITDGYGIEVTDFKSGFDTKSGEYYTIDVKMSIAPACEVKIQFILSGTTLENFSERTFYKHVALIGTNIAGYATDLASHQ